MAAVDFALNRYVETGLLHLNNIAQYNHHPELEYIARSLKSNIWEKKDKYIYLLLHDKPRKPKEISNYIGCTGNVEKRLLEHNGAPGTRTVSQTKAARGYWKIALVFKVPEPPDTKPDQKMGRLLRTEFRNGYRRDSGRLMGGIELAQKYRQKCYVSREFLENEKWPKLKELWVKHNGVDEDPSPKSMLQYYEPEIWQQYGSHDAYVTSVFPDLAVCESASFACSESCASPASTRERSRSRSRESSDSESGGGDDKEWIPPSKSRRKYRARKGYGW